MAPPFRHPELIVPTDEFPANERSAIFLAASQAMLLDVFAYSIAAAVALIDYCEMGLGAPDEWREIAARDVAMNAYHFSRALKFIDKLNAPSVRGRYDKEAVDSAIRITNARIPDAEAIRNAVGHVADNVRSMDVLLSHAVDGNHALGRLDGRTFSVTKDGRRYVLVIDASLAETVRNAARMVMGAFMDAGIIRHPVPA